MKFDKLCDLALNEMARAAKSTQFGKVKIDPIEITPDKITNIKMYLLDQFNDEIKAGIFNKIINNMKDQSFDSYDDLYNFVTKQVSEGIKEQNGKQNSTQLKYTTRVVFNTLGPNRLKVITPIESVPSSETPEQPTETDEVRKGIYTISNQNFLDDGIDRLQSFPPTILQPITNYFEENDGKSLPEMKLRGELINAVKEFVSGYDEKIQDKVLKRLKQDNMSELFIKLKASKSIATEKDVKKPSDEEEVPLLDIPEDEPEEILSADVERMTGGYRPEQDYDWERSGGVDFG